MRLINIPNVFILIWRNDDIHIEYLLKNLTKEDVIEITNNIGVTPTCKLGTYTGIYMNG